jgi:hypothetical protein
MKKKISWGLFGVGVLIFLLAFFSEGEMISEKLFFISWGILVPSIFFINFKLFFFGFLAKKWKRLIRSILIIGVISIIIFLKESKSVREGELYLIFNFICIPSISLVSWVVKPFIIKEN